MRGLRLNYKANGRRSRGAEMEAFAGWPLSKAHAIHVFIVYYSGCKSAGRGRLLDALMLLVAISRGA